MAICFRYTCVERDQTHFCQKNCLQRQKRKNPFKKFWILKSDCLIILNLELTTLDMKTEKKGWGGLTLSIKFVVISQLNPKRRAHTFNGTEEESSDRWGVKEDKCQWLMVQQMLATQRVNVIFKCIWYSWWVCWLFFESTQAKCWVKLNLNPGKKPGFKSLFRPAGIPSHCLCIRGNNMSWQRNPYVVQLYNLPFSVENQTQYTGMMWTGGRKVKIRRLIKKNKI